MMFHHPPSTATCPECGGLADHEPGFPGSRYEQREPEGYRCQDCEHFFQVDPGDHADWLYEQMRDREAFEVDQ